MFYCSLLALAIPGPGGVHQRGPDPQSFDPHCSLGGGIPQHDGCGGSQNWPFSAYTVFTVGHSQVKNEGFERLHIYYLQVLQMYLAVCFHVKFMRRMVFIDEYCTFHFSDIETRNISCFHFKVENFTLISLSDPCICTSTCNKNTYFEMFGLKNCSCALIVIFVTISCLILELVGETWTEAVMATCSLWQWLAGC